MEFALDDARQLLGRTPTVIEALLSGLPEHWLHANEGEDTFSPFEVVGHLLHGERTDWMDRVDMILEHGERQAFEPFDRFAHRAESKGKSMTDLLGEFATLRSDNLARLAERHVGAEDLGRTGRHPNLGAVTLQQLLSAWVVHDLGHIGQIVRVMAKQYGEEAGPWAEYLPVLTR